jgi:hypothetical protein
VTDTPRTKAGAKLLWMFDLERNGQGRIVTRTFDARLTRRIVEEFVTRIEREAAENAAAVLSGAVQP